MSQILPLNEDNPSIAVASYDGTRADSASLHEIGSAAAAEQHSVSLPFLPEKSKSSTFLILNQRELSPTTTPNIVVTEPETATGTANVKIVNDHDDHESEDTVGLDFCSQILLLSLTFFLFFYLFYVLDEMVGVKIVSVGNLNSSTNLNLALENQTDSNTANQWQLPGMSTLTIQSIACDCEIGPFLLVWLLLLLVFPLTFVIGPKLDLWTLKWILPFISRCCIKEENPISTNAIVNEDEGQKVETNITEHESEKFLEGLNIITLNNLNNRFKLALLNDNMIGDSHNNSNNYYSNYANNSEPSPSSDVIGRQVAGDLLSSYKNSQGPGYYVDDGICSSVPVPLEESMADLNSPRKQLSKTTSRSYNIVPNSKS